MNDAPAATAPRPTRGRGSRARGRGRSLSLAGLALAALSAVLPAQETPVSLPAVTPQPDSVLAAILNGVVRDGGGRPLNGAVISARGAEELAFSDRDGRFSLRGVPPGEEQVIIRRIGYYPAILDMEFAPGTSVHVVARMVPTTAVALGAIVIEGESLNRGLFQRGFYERVRTQPTGRFLSPEEIDRRRPTRPSTLLRELPELELVSIRGGSDMVPLGRMGAGGSRCRMNLWVDGTLWQAVENEGIDRLLNIREIRAVEVYPSIFSTPAMFQRPQTDCGSIVIWTRGVMTR